jgi:hypothetical protein
VRGGTRIRVALAVSAGLGLVPLLAAAPAAAQACTPAPACLREAGEGGVEDAGGGGVEDAGNEVRDTPEEVRQNVDETVGGDSGAVDDVLNPGSGVGPGGGGGSDPGGDEGSGRGNDPGGRDRGGRGAQNGARGGASQLAGPSVTTRLTAGSASARAPGAGSASSLTQPRPPDRSVGIAGGGSGAQIAAEVAFRLGLPLALLLALAAVFVAVQNRLDRRDPKLLASSLDQELLTFR